MLLVGVVGAGCGLRARVCEALERGLAGARVDGRGERQAGWAVRVCVRKVSCKCGLSRGFPQELAGRAEGSRRVGARLRVTCGWRER